MRQLLGDQGLLLAAESSAPQALVDSPGGRHFDVVVVEPDSSRDGPVRAIRCLHEAVPGARIVVITPSTHDHDVRRALRAGADGVVLDHEAERTLRLTVLSVLAGQICLPRELRHHAEKPALSYREKQVLGMAMTGATNRQIADSLFLAESTVKSHVASAFRKLGVRSRAEAAVVLETDPAHVPSFPLEQPRRVVVAVGANGSG